MNKIKLISITGTRLVGKDTLYKLLRELDDRFVRVSFADELKALFEDISFTLFDRRVDQLSPEQKEILRPWLIQVGTKAREKDINIWAKKVEGFIDDSIFNGRIPVITDMRFKSEHDFYKNIYGDGMFLINLSRNGAPDPTDEEKIYGPEVAKLADYSLTWHSDPTSVSLRPIVADFYQKFLT
jgi:hypothetical protein